MKYLLRTLVLTAWIAFTPPMARAISDEHSTEKNYFQFVIPHYHTARQSGQDVDVYVRYAYRANLPVEQYPDYRELRTSVLRYMEPSEELPRDTFWEIIATQMGTELMKNFPLDGISIQLNVHDNQTPPSYEPGDHGPVFTTGNIAPLDVH